MLDKRQQFSFVWGFNGSDAVNLQSCTPIAIFVDRDAENGSAQAAVPPYSVITYPEQGIPTVDLLGNIANQTPTSWTPRFAAGTKVLISVVDALGNSGGVAQSLYTVGAGTSTSCIPASSTSDVQMSISASNTLQTCDTVPIQIQGGTKPYELTFSVTNASSSVNETMSAQNDFYQWINRAAPGQSLIIAVSDSTGQYASTSQFFTTAGTADVTCPGKSDSQSVFGAGSSSLPGSSSAITASASTAPQTGATHKTKSLTGPIVGTIIALLIVFGAVAFWFFRKKKSRSYDDDYGGPGAGPINTGFGMKDYKRGGNMPGNDSFVPLHDSSSPSAPRTPLYTDQHSSPHTANNSLSGPGGQRPVSGFDYYASPPSNYSGTVESSVPSRMGTSSGSSRTGLGVGLAAGAGAGAAAVAGHQTKRQMMLEEQQRQQRWPGGMHSPPAPESVYPPVSTYTANPFADPTHPYRQAAPSVVVSEAPQNNTAYGYTGPTGYGASQAPYQPSHTGSGAPSGGVLPASKQSGSSQDSTMTPAARAKAAEAARERVPSQGYDDDEEPIPYMQRQRPVLGVTNPDRASTATSNSANDPYGGIDRSRPPTQVFQHEDAGVVVELPPAYREFPGAGGNTGGAGAGGPRPS